MTELTAYYQRAADGFAVRLALVADADWVLGTPCTEWSVRDLVAHVLDEQLWIPPLVGEETIADVGDRFAGDQLGTDASGAWARAQVAVLAALAPEGAEDRTVGLSFGEASAAEYVWQVAVDTLIHTWDLARAIGADEELPCDDVRRALDELAPMLEAWRAAGVFGPVVEVGPEADDQTRLLAVVGRTR